MKTDSKGVTTIEETDVAVIETDCGDPTKDVKVYRDAAGRYHVMNGGTVRHPDSSAEDVMRALGWYLQGALYTPTKEPQRKLKAPPDDGPIKGEAVAQRMMAICGCTGQYDCDCVAVKSQATGELWCEHNTRRRQASCNKT